MSQFPAITISRSLGSGGTEVGFLVSRLLGWHFCDRRILRMVSEAIGQSTASLARLEEHHQGYLEKLFPLFAMGTPEATYMAPMEIPMYSRELFDLESKVIFKLLQHAPSVVMGRGGFITLRDRAATLHVSIHSDLAFRIQTLVGRGKAPDQDAARQAIITSDQDRAAFIKEISGLDWHDPKHFHIVLDVSKYGSEACAKMIEDEFHRHFPFEFPVQGSGPV